MAAQFVRRYNENSAITTFPPFSELGHAQETQYVIDWIALTMESSGGANCTFSIIDAADTGTHSVLTTFLFTTEIAIAAGEVDSMFFPFPGGFPLKHPNQQPGTEVSDDTLAGQPTASGSLSVQCDASSWSAFIGFHVEPAGNRK